MGKYYCPCGVVLDHDELMGFGFERAMWIMIDHLKCIKLYNKPGRYEPDAEDSKD